MEPGDAPETPGLIIHMINELIAHDYLEDGVWGCLKRLQTNQLVDNSLIHHFVLTAEIEGEIVGTVEIRNTNHISVFCVEKEFRRRGIGRELLRIAVEICVKNTPNLSKITVNSLPNTVHIYARLGFLPNIPEGMQGDIPYTPMLLDLTKVNPLQPVPSRSHN